MPVKSSSSPGSVGCHGDGESLHTVVVVTDTSGFTGVTVKAPGRIKVRPLAYNEEIKCGPTDYIFSYTEPVVIASRFLASHFLSNTLLLASVASLSRAS